MWHHYPSHHQTIPTSIETVTCAVNDPSVSIDDHKPDLPHSPPAPVPTSAPSPSPSPPAAATAACTATAAATAAFAASAAASADPRLAAASTAATVSDMETTESADGFRCFLEEAAAPGAPLVDDAPGPLWSDVVDGGGGRVPTDEEASLGPSFCLAASGWSLLLLVPVPPLGFVGTLVPFSASVSRLATCGLRRRAWGGVGVAEQARRGVSEGRRRRSTSYNKCPLHVCCQRRRT